MALKITMFSSMACWVVGCGAFISAAVGRTGHETTEAARKRRLEKLDG